MVVKNNDIFLNKRVANTNDSTLGILFHNEIPIGFVVEDEPRAVKVIGETRIPAGKYKLSIRKLKTPMTIKYRNKYKWFKNHIELEKVPGFTGIYVHIGNTEKDTMGCQIIGLDASIALGHFVNMRSTLLFQEWYNDVYFALESGLTIYWEITDN